MYSRTTISKGSGVTRRMTVRVGSTTTEAGAAVVAASLLTDVDDVDDDGDSIAILKSSLSLAISIQCLDVAVRKAPLNGI